jgi:hypothetical protein
MIPSPQPAVFLYELCPRAQGRRREKRKLAGKGCELIAFDTNTILPVFCRPNI